MVHKHMKGGMHTTPTQLVDSNQYALQWDLHIISLHVWHANFMKCDIDQPADLLHSDKLVCSLFKVCVSLGQLSSELYLRLESYC